MNDSISKSPARASGARGIRTPSVGLIIAAVLALLVLGRTFLLDFAVVDGRSMMPGLRPGDVVAIFKAAYGLRNPLGGYFALWSEPGEREIVAAIRPDSRKIVIKRVWMEGGSRESPRDGAAERAFFLLGDNKYESVDSREFGPVPMNNILGKAFRFPFQ